MKTVSYPLRDINFPTFIETYPTEEERIELIGYGIFCNDILVKTSLKQIKMMKSEFKSKGKICMMTRFIELNDFVSEAPKIDASLSLTGFIIGSEKQVLEYLILSEMLMNREIIRILAV